MDAGGFGELLEGDYAVGDLSVLNEVDYLDKTPYCLWVSPCLMPARWFALQALGGSHVTHWVRCGVTSGGGGGGGSWGWGIAIQGTRQVPPTSCVDQGWAR
ncbi:hypothetical protein HPP92_017705 [Vanilla planifolia]|uniref:Uncharacterized protein n=1 Tax=Vanilla planifolia TaxID=51239 RepID=A0A835QFZ9_VANPL|nr:hypothetical protein HPP92_017705 [Vanilla planifolia]